MATHPTFTWSAHEYVYQKKTADWFWAVGIITISAAVITIIFGNILFAILILVGAAALTLFAAREPHLVNFKIDERGLYVEKNLYPFATLESFWVEHNDHLGFPSKILVKSKKRIMPLIVIPLDEVDPQDIHDVLDLYLKEEEHIEPLSQKLMEYLGF
ncbi:MAG: hypothetical protein PHF79_02275 [Candidatus Pacebacteria bacterium]|nr:hypothetical protein [Candidatus Paceibacterota bacterium]